MNPTTSDLDQATPAKRNTKSAQIDDTLARATREYRKRAHMTQGLLAEFVGISRTAIQHLEHHEPVTDETRAKMREFLANADSSRRGNLRGLKRRPTQVYLTAKLLTWARITQQPAESVEAVRALKEAYDRAKREEGLASIPLIQLEVENALTLATRGAYYRAQRLD